MDKIAEHEKRSQEIGDSIRVFLTGLNTGGIAVTLAIASGLKNGDNQKWTLWPIQLFIAGLLIIGVSLFLAKHRELKRKDAVKKNEAEPDFTGLFWRSYTWDIISFLFFILALVVELCTLWNF